jgi:hypothetical protein
MVNVMFYILHDSSKKKKKRICARTSLILTCQAVVPNSAWLESPGGAIKDLPQCDLTSLGRPQEIVSKSPGDSNLQPTLTAQSIKAENIRLPGLVSRVCHLPAV